ncbi:MAG: aminodeoxychorismate synthase component I [Roseiarcus sp.]|jgi:para-aminobenzoate synthetase component 1
MWHRELDPIEAIDAAERLSSLRGMAFLDSAMRHPVLGRYSYLAVEPFGTFVVREGAATWNGAPLEGPPLDVLRALLDRYRCEPAPGLPPFQGGCIGYFAYEFARRLETLMAPKCNGAQCDEVGLHFYDVVLAFDHQQGRCWLVASGFPEIDPGRRELRARARLDQVSRQLERRPEPIRAARGAEDAIAWESNFSRQTYMAAVERVKEYILSGDIYQANISQRFVATLPANFEHWSFYRKLRRENPAPFAAFLSFDGLSLASSSPERFLRLQDGRVETRPIKGTEKRFADLELDRSAALRLQNSEKDRAENIMIVDLMRNDLSRVCAPGTVEAPLLCALESYASVHHLVSVVTGRLQDDADAIDLFQACFPGGSVTGAPKIRSMDIIAELEEQARQAYCGAIGYLGFDGNLDTNIAIRTVILRGRTAIFQAGGGITLMSDSAQEYEETLAKAQRIFAAFEGEPFADR